MCVVKFLFGRNIIKQIVSTSLSALMFYSQSLIHLTSVPQRVFYVTFESLVSVRTKVSPEGVSRIFDGQQINNRLPPPLSGNQNNAVFTDYLPSSQELSINL